MSKTFKKLSVVEMSSDFGKAVRVVEVPLVPTQDNEVLIKNIYAGVNATDIYISAGRHITDGKLQFDIGFEGLGVIEAVGKNVSTLKVGQPVVLISHFFFGVTPMAYSEYLYSNVKDVIPVPSLNPEFISLLICGLTASIGLDKTGCIKAGDKVLITASAGGTGHIAVQWAKKKGCYVIGMTSSPEKAKLLKELGTDRVINYKTENLDEVLTKEYPSGVDVVWETIGGQVFETLLKHLGPRGRLVMVGATGDYKKDGFPAVKIPDPLQLLLNNQSITGFALGGFLDLVPQYLKQLIADLTDKRLKVVLDFGQNISEGQFKGIDSVVRGVEHLNSGKNTGKVVIKIQNE